MTMNYQVDTDVPTGSYGNNRSDVFGDGSWYCLKDITFSIIDAGWKGLVSFQ
jgi:hypothetical protein